MQNNIESHLVEKRVFKPSRDFAKNTRIKSLDQYRRMYRESIRQPAKFWGREASELVWRAPWKKVLEWKAPFAKWFVRGTLKISEKCLDRHLSAEGFRANKAAFILAVEHGDRRMIICRRAGNSIHMEEGRDVWWHRELEYVDANCAPAPLDSEHPLYLLYTRGSTGKPKGILHTTGGYLVGVYSTMKYVFDIRDEDIFWCTADVGWVTGHSYIVYGPLANGATVVMYEGAPNWPEPDRFWKIIEDYRVNILYTAPTAIRAFIRWGDEWVKKHDLSSLRLLGT